MPHSIHVAFRSECSSLGDRLRRLLSGLFPLPGTQGVHCVPAVAIPFRRLVVHLSKGQLLAIRDGSGCAVRCVSGELWITQDCSTRDVILSAHEEFVLDLPGLALVHATKESVACVTRPAPVPSPEHAWWIKFFDMDTAAGKP
ncbi:MAG: DUF2917 domain-containing protein [Pseudomonadota bacterium]